MKLPSPYMAFITGVGKYWVVVKLQLGIRGVFGVKLQKCKVQVTKYQVEYTMFYSCCSYLHRVNV